MLCLCPNDHVLFDRGMIAVDENGHILGRERRTLLRKSSGHEIGQEYLRYHLEHIFVARAEGSR
jgi:putative restriction endonuclease